MRVLCGPKVIGGVLSHDASVHGCAPVCQITPIIIIIMLLQANTAVRLQHCCYNQAAVEFIYSLFVYSLQ